MEVIYVRAERCMGCKSCEVACAVQHSESKTFTGALFQSPSPMKRLYVEAAGAARFPVMCRHCDTPSCMDACISGCLYKDDRGFVRRHKERCVGCWSCIMACPFGVVTRDAQKHLAVKCDRCHKLDVPACVNACPTKALVVRDVDAVPAEQRHKVVLVEQG